MKKEYRNYAFVLICAFTIVLFVLFHLIHTINKILIDFNKFIDFRNNFEAQDIPEYVIGFFGRGFKDISFIADLLLVFIIILVCLLIFLKIYWTVLDNQKDVNLELIIGKVNLHELKEN